MTERPNPPANDGNSPNNRTIVISTGMDDLRRSPNATIVNGGSIEEIMKGSSLQPRYTELSKPPSELDRARFHIERAIEHLKNAEDDFRKRSYETKGDE